MKKTLDLSVFEEMTLDIKLPAGKTVRLQKPTQEMVIELMKFRSINEETEAEDIMRAVDNLCLLIMNTNDLLEKYTVDQMNELFNTQMKLRLIEAYSEFIMGVQSDPN